MVGIGGLCEEVAIGGGAIAPNGLTDSAFDFGRIDGDAFRLPGTNEGTGGVAILLVKVSLVIAVLSVAPSKSESVLRAYSAISSGYCKHDI